MKRIVLTGGGTAGHVTPNLAILPLLRQEGWEVLYIGSENGIEKKLIEAEGVPYYSIPTGKLRRYLSRQNITDMFRVVKGVSEATKLLKKLKPDLVFSKGGFVAVPVVLGAKKNKIPVIIHESDITPGLANKIAMPFAKTVCTTFPETLKYVPKEKGIHTGTPIRAELFTGDRQKGLEACGFDGTKPVLLQMGGSLGAVKLNDALRESLPSLLKDFDIIHLCGKGHKEESLEGTKGYRQFEYVTDGLADLFAANRCDHCPCGQQLHLRVFGTEKASSADSPFRKGKPRRPDSERRVLRKTGLCHGAAGRRTDSRNYGGKSA